MGDQFKLFQANLHQTGVQPDIADTEIFITVTTKTSSFSATTVGKGKVSKGKYFLWHEIIYQLGSTPSF
jgi:hypothetical protein